MGRKFEPAKLTPEEQVKFGYLLRKPASDSNAPDIRSLLEELKGKGVSLEDLGVSLLVQFGLDSLPEAKIAAETRRRRAFGKRVAAVRELCRRLTADHNLLAADGIPPPVFLELLKSLDRSLAQASARALAVAPLLSARLSTNRRRSRRPLVPLPRGVDKDAARALRRALLNCEKGGATIRYGVPPRCPTCSNPAPGLFSERE